MHCKGSKVKGVRTRKNSEKLMLLFLQKASNRTGPLENDHGEGLESTLIQELMIPNFSDCPISRSPYSSPWCTELPCYPSTQDTMNMVAPQAPPSQV